MNELDEPHSALFGVLVSQPSASSTTSAGAKAPTVGFSKVALTVIGAALLSCLWWMAV